MKKRVLRLLPVLTSALILGGCNFGLQSSLYPETPSEPVEVVSAEPDSVPGNTENPDVNWTKPGKEEKESEPEKPKEKDPYKFDFDSHEPNDWQKAYCDFIKKLEPSKAEAVDVFEINRYFLADVDGTHAEFVPELFIRTGTCEADYELQVYTYDQYSEEVVQIVGPGEIFAGHSQFFLGPNGNLYSYSGHMGYLWVTEYEIGPLGAKSKTIYEEDINGDPEADYTPIDEIMGDEIRALTDAPVTDDTLLLWYQNIPFSTRDENTDPVDAFDKIFEVFYDNAEVYVVGGDDYYDGITGLHPFFDILKPGAVDSYSTVQYVLTMYCPVDVNFDGQDELLVRIASDERMENGEYSFRYLLMSNQDDVIYTYVLPFMGYDGSLIVTHYSVYDNFYNPSEPSYYGVLFDKDRCRMLYTDTTEDKNASKSEANIWKTFRVDFGY